MRAVLILTGAVLFSCAVGGQSFEVASIRVHQDPPEGTLRRVGISVSGSRVGATAVGVRGLIGFAYGLDIEGDLPKDIGSERYDVAARAGGDGELTRRIDPERRAGVPRMAARRRRKPLPAGVRVVRFERPRKAAPLSVAYAPAIVGCAAQYAGMVFELVASVACAASAIRCAAGAVTSSPVT